MKIRVLGCGTSTGVPKVGNDWGLRISQLYLVHIGNGRDYRTLVAELPAWAAPARDGLEIELR